MSAEVAAAGIAAMASLGSAGISAWALIATSRGTASTHERLDQHGQMLSTLVRGGQETSESLAEIDSRLDRVEHTQMACAECPRQARASRGPMIHRPPAPAAGG